MGDRAAGEADLSRARGEFERASEEGSEHPVEQIEALHAVHARLLAATTRRLERHNG